MVAREKLAWAILLPTLLSKSCSRHDKFDNQRLQRAKNKAASTRAQSDIAARTLTAEAKHYFCQQFLMALFAFFFKKYTKRKFLARELRRTQKLRSRFLGISSLSEEEEPSLNVQCTQTLNALLIASFWNRSHIRGGIKKHILLHRMVADESKAEMRIVHTLC